MLYPDTYATGSTNGHPPAEPLPALLIHILAGKPVTCQGCGDTLWSEFDLDWKHYCRAAAS